VEVQYSPPAIFYYRPASGTFVARFRPFHLPLNKISSSAGSNKQFPLGIIPLQYLVRIQEKPDSGASANGTSITPPLPSRARKLLRNHKAADKALSATCDCFAGGASGILPLSRRPKTRLIRSKYSLLYFPDWDSATIVSLFFEATCRRPLRPPISRRPPLEPSAGTKKIGLIGLGLMGPPHGHESHQGRVLSHQYGNRTHASRANELVAAGCELAKSPQEVAAASDFLLTIGQRSTPRWKRFCGVRNGAMQALRRGKHVRGFPAPFRRRWPAKIAAACAERRRAAFSTLTGSRAAIGDAKKGELLFMIGGDAGHR